MSAPLQNALAMLTAMIAPALAFSASALLLLPTTQRLARISDRLRALPRSETGERQRQSARLAWVEHALSLLYLAQMLFLLCSLFIGVALAFAPGLYWLPVLCGSAGAALLCSVCFCLWREIRLGIAGRRLEALR